jgi:hypothetical protein
LAHERLLIDSALTESPGRHRRVCVTGVSEADSEVTIKFEPTEAGVWCERCGRRAPDRLDPKASDRLDPKSVGPHME